MKSRKRRWSLAIRYILLLLGGAVSVMPMIYMLSTSLRPNGALYEFPPHFFPKLSEITLENYRYIFAQEKFYLNFLNSVIVALVTIVLAAIIATALAYCLARFEFPGKKLLFALVIGMMIIPGTTLIIPQFQLASFFGITNSLAGLIPFYVAWVIPLSTFMIVCRRRERIHGVLPHHTAACQSCHRVGKHLQLPHRVGGIHMGDDRYQR